MCDSSRAGKRGEKACENPRRSGRRRHRLDPLTPLSERILLLPSQLASWHRLPPPFGARGGGGDHSHKWLPHVVPPALFGLSRSVASCFRQWLIRTIPPVASPCGLRFHGRCAFAITLALHMTLSSRWWVQTREERRGRVGNSYRGSDLKVPGTDVLTKTLRTKFLRRRPISKNAAPQDRATPLVAVVLLAASVEFHPHGRGCSAFRAVVDVERSLVI
jgi:hypothetical protein